MERVEWFRNHVRVTLEGDESALESLSIPRAALIRKIRPGRRAAVVERNDAAALSAAPPPKIRISIEELDIEALASEWMQ